MQPIGFANRPAPFVPAVARIVWPRLSPRVAPKNFVFVDPPTTPELLESTFVRSLLKRNLTDGRQLKLDASYARHLLTYLQAHASFLTPEDHKLELRLRAFTGEWAKQQRRAWRALTFTQARAHKTAPVRVEDRRREPQAREARPSRRQRTSATARGSPGSRSAEDDDPHDLVRGSRGASGRRTA